VTVGCTVAVFRSLLRNASARQSQWGKLPIPSSELQRNFNDQASVTCERECYLKMGDWMFSGACNLQLNAGSSSVYDPTTFVVSQHSTKSVNFPEN
jgi:hypothetical protein